MEFVEALVFTRLVTEYLDDDAYRELQAYLASNPKGGRRHPRHRRLSEGPLG